MPNGEKPFLIPLTDENLMDVRAEEVLCYNKSELVARDTVDSVMEMIQGGKKMYPKMTHFTVINNSTVAEVLEETEKEFDINDWQEMKTFIKSDSGTYKGKVYDEERNCLIVGVFAFLWGKKPYISTGSKTTKELQEIEGAKTIKIKKFQF